MSIAYIVPLPILKQVLLSQIKRTILHSTACFRLTNIFHQMSFSRRKWRLWKCERQCGLNNNQQQTKVTLPTSKNGAHSKQIGMFTLITSSKLCHCRSCFVWVCYITPGKQLWAVFAIPGTDRTRDVCIIPDPLIPGGCLSISVTWWVCWWTIQTFVQSCVL